MKKALKRALLISSAAIALTPSIGALAQQATSASKTRPAARAAGGVEEVVVTANKRQERLQKVGLTVTAITGAALAQRGIRSLSDLANAVPGLQYTPSSSNTPVFTLRGVGFNDNSLGIYPAVSVYLDQAPLPFPVLATHSAYDLQRVEVLKGPQGTLFGENSTGGAINYIAAKPTDKLEAGGDVGYGRFNQTQSDAYVSGPITDTLRARLALSQLHADGWQDSATRSGDRNGSQSYLAGRFLVDWDASDAVHFHFNLNAWRDTSQPEAGQIIALRPQSPPALPQERTAPLSPANSDQTADWSTGLLRPRGDREFLQAALRADFDLPYDLTLTSLTSYDTYKQRMTIDSDGSALTLNDLQSDDGSIHSINQELRIANSSASHFRWIVGSNGEHSLTYESQDLRYFDDSVDSPALDYIDNSAVANTQRFTNYAFFGNAEYDILPSLTAKGGVRYTSTKDDDEICGTSPGDAHVATLYNALGKALSKVPFAPLGPNNCYTLNQNNAPGQPFIDTLAQNNVSWRGGLDYRLDDTTLLYANISRGYKAGSFPSLAASTFNALRPVSQERVTSYETGLKVSFWDRKAQLNTAGFYYDYSGKQVRGKEGDPVFGILDLEVNIPKSRVFGFEEDLTLRPIEGLTLNPNVTFLDSEIQKYAGFNVLGQVENFAGERLPFTPKWSYGVNADYRYELPGGGAPFAGISIDGHTSADAALGGSGITIPAAPGTRVDPGITHPFVLNAYTTVDARIGYESADGRWKVMLWGKNIFNKYYWSNVVIADDSVFRLAAFPATYGVTLTVKLR